MEQRAILAVAVSLAILLVYNEFILPTVYPGGSSSPVIEDSGAPVPAPDAADMAQPPLHGDSAPLPQLAAEPEVPAQRVVVETDFYTAILTSAGGRIESFRLKDHRTAVDPESPGLEMVEPAENGDLPLGVELRGLENDGGSGKVITLGDRTASYAMSAEGTLRLADADVRVVEMIWNGPGGTIKKRLTFRGDRRDIDVAIVGEGMQPRYTQLALSWPSPVSSAEHESLFDRIEYLQGRSLEQYHLDDSDLLAGQVVEPPRTAEDPAWKWVGLSGKHFLVAMVPLHAAQQDPESAAGFAEPHPTLFMKQRTMGSASGQKFLRAQLLFPVRASAVEQDVKLYLGAKSVELLEPVGHTLSRAVDLGWFSFIALPLLWMLRKCHAVTGNYGVDIVLLTVLIKILFLPLTQKSFTAMKGMQKLQPEMQKMREQLKDKPEQMQKEMMELYRKHGVNPLGGCLPMVVQIPVFVGLYQALLNAVELRHAPFVGWITDLSAPDRLGSLPIPFVDPAGIPVLTLVMGASMFLQQWMTPSAADPTQQRIMMILPVVFTFMFLSFPAGLVLYWTVNNLLTIAQQYYVHQSAD